MPPRYGSLPVTSNLFHVSAFEPSRFVSSLQRGAPLGLRHAACYIRIIQRRAVVIQRLLVPTSLQLPIVIVLLSPKINLSSSYRRRFYEVEGDVRRDDNAISRKSTDYVCKTIVWRVTTSRWQTGTVGNCIRSRSKACDLQIVPRSRTASLSLSLFLLSARASTSTVETCFHVVNRANVNTRIMKYARENLPCANERG